MLRLQNDQIHDCLLLTCNNVGSLNLYMTVHITTDRRGETISVIVFREAVFKRYVLLYIHDIARIACCTHMVVVMVGYSCACWRGRGLHFDQPTGR